MKKRNKLSSIIALALAIMMSQISCNNSQTTEDTTEEVTTPRLIIKLLEKTPHSTDSFTEGLEFYKGNLYESGAFVERFPKTNSTIGKVNITSGEIEKNVVLDKSLYFSEGITILNDKIYHVTYKNQKGFIYDVNTFKKLREFSYDNAEGWGLTNDGKSIIMSDGTHTLTYLNPVTLEVERKLPVFENNQRKNYLNELEYVNGFIYSNVWQTNQIVKIDPNSGQVVGQIDISSFKQDADNKFPESQEANGIAFNAADSTLLITGKLWPNYYKIKIL